VIQVRDGRSVFSPGEAVELVGTGSTDPGDLELTYLWDFGDGKTSTVPITTHSYNRTGYYVVRLTVTNEFGLNNSVTYPITIRTEASASAFLGIAAAIVAGLFALFVLLPAWRRRAQPPPPRREPLPPKTSDETAPPKNRRDARSSKKASRAALQTGSSSVVLDDEQAVVIEELEREFENAKKPKTPP
jgi:PKD repeat protein